MYRVSAGAEGRYPGERQARTEAERIRTGILVPPALLEELQALGARTACCCRTHPGDESERLLYRRSPCLPH
jgi:hypothetical protein